MNVPIGLSTSLSIILGGGVGLGLFLIITGRTRGIRLSAPHRLLPRTSAAALGGIAAGLATGWPVGGVLVASACWALPTVLGRDPGHASRVRRVEAIAVWAEMLRDTLSAAAGLEQAVHVTARLAPHAIRNEVHLLAERLRQGEALAPALRRLAADLADPTADLVIAALALSARHPARHLADLLSSLAHTAREQASMRLRIEAGRARTRTSVRMIIGTTVTFAVLLVLLNPTFVAAYAPMSGQLVLAGIGVLFAVGLAWLSRVAHIPAPRRFLLADVGGPA